MLALFQAGVWVGWCFGVITALVGLLVWANSPRLRFLGRGD